MEMALCYLDALLDDNIFELTEQEQFSKIQTFLSYLEQLLGAQAGKLPPFADLLRRRNLMPQMKKSFNQFLLLWSGDFISAIGSGMTSFGLGVYIFQQTGKASFMALVTLLAFLPSLLLSPLAGVLADRYDRRILMALGTACPLSVFCLFFYVCCVDSCESGTSASRLQSILFSPPCWSLLTRRPLRIC